MQKIETGYPPNSDFDRAARAGLPGQTDTAPAQAGEAQEGDAYSEPTTPERLLEIAQAADKQAVTFAQQHWRRNWEQNYKSFRSEYVDNSKYKSADFRHRSKIFRPKTRIAVTKNAASAAQTLFATVDSLSVTAGDETDPMQVANAELIGALVNYRLDRTSRQAAIPWFLTSMGARQDCDIMGVCVSKQGWDFEEHPTEINQKTGKKKRIKDKPFIELFPGENVGLDPAAHWTDPVQSGCFFYVRMPQHVQDVRARMKDKRVPWLPVTDSQIWTTAKVKDFESAQVRRAREGGADRMDNQTATVEELDVVWIYEWFIRTAEGDWNFWTLGTNHLLSTPQLTEKTYPWKGGERPYKIGYGNLEAHRIVPQSPVETLRPLQQEINDITNLRLDNLKQVIQPVALVKSGKKIDTDALKRRYPVLFVQDPENDVKWDRPPDSAASSFAETSRLDTDFDDLAGNFNGGSVANNRQVGETVGGMRLMAGAANAVSEFYVRLWVETWVEPVLADVAKLEAYYEDDEKVLALAKKRAPSMAKYGISEVTDELLEQDVLVRVSAGVGSPDPMQKMAKMAGAIEQLSKVLPFSPAFKSGALRLKDDAWINEIMGNAGQRDGFDRFFEMGQPMPQPGEAAPTGMSPEQEMQTKDADRQSKEKIAALNAKTKIASEVIKHGAGRHQQHRDQKHDGKRIFMESIMDALSQHREDQHRAADREAAARQPMAASPGPAFAQI